jgi:hypothetical protein
VNTGGSDDVEWVARAGGHAKIGKEERKSESKEDAGLLAFAVPQWQDKHADRLRCSAPQI